MRNAETATTCVEDWEKVNGTDSGRKAHIDWGEWEKKFGMKITKRERRESELMDYTDFDIWQKARKLPSPEIKRKWQRLCNDSSIQAEGVGSAKMLWLERNRKKHTDEEAYEDGAYVEGSNAKKNMNDSEIAKLKKLAISSASDFSGGFLNSWNIGQSSSSRDEEQPEENK